MTEPSRTLEDGLPAVYIMSTKPLGPVWRDFISTELTTRYTVTTICDSDRSPSVSDSACIAAGFVHATSYKRVSAWDRALYHYYANPERSAYAWFSEYDVYIPGVRSLRSIDAVAEDADLVSNSPQSVRDLPQWPHWKRLGLRDDSVPAPYRCMVCLTRISRALIDEVGRYAARHGTLSFHEYLFPTLARSTPSLSQLTYPNHLKVAITWNLKIDSRTHDPRVMYHPVKREKDHAVLRGRLPPE